MKTITLVFLALPFLAFANPVPKPEAEPEIANIEKRAVTCALNAPDVRYRRGPTTQSIADGQFGKAGTKVSFSCFTSGESINGNSLWNKIASGTGKGDYVSDTFISRACSDQISKLC